MIFNTKWKKRYELDRSKIEDLGWDKFIEEIENTPFDLFDPRGSLK